jgi:hypothetical protein
MNAFLPRCRLFALALLLALAVPRAAHAKAAFFGKEEMIRRAEIIALVNVTAVEPVKVKTRGWTLSQAARASVERVLKSELPRQVTLYGGEDFICAQVRYQPGRCLVFLRREEGRLRGVNWHLGVRPVKDGQVVWFANDKNPHAMKPVPLADVWKEIEAVLAVK